MSKEDPGETRPRNLPYSSENPLNVDQLSLIEFSRLAEAAKDALSDFQRGVDSVEGSVASSLFGDAFMGLCRLDSAFCKTQIDCGQLRSTSGDDRLSTLTGLLKATRKLLRSRDGVQVSFAEKKKRFRFPESDIRIFDLYTSKLLRISRSDTSLNISNDSTSDKSVEQRYVVLPVSVSDPQPSSPFEAANFTRGMVGALAEFQHHLKLAIPVGRFCHGATNLIHATKRLALLGEAFSYRSHFIRFALRRLHSAPPTWNGMVITSFCELVWDAVSQAEIRVRNISGTGGDLWYAPWTDEKFAKQESIYAEGWQKLCAEWRSIDFVESNSLMHGVDWEYAQASMLENTQLTSEWSKFLPPKQWIVLYKDAGHSMSASTWQRRKKGFRLHPKSTDKSVSIHLDTLKEFGVAPPD